MGGSELVLPLDKLTNVSLSITFLVHFLKVELVSVLKIRVETCRVRNFPSFALGSDCVTLGSPCIYSHVCFVGLCLDKGVEGETCLMPLR